MEPSLRPLRDASARQRTFISPYTLHSHGQLIYLPCLRIKGVGVGGGGGVYASTHFHYVVVYVFGWGMGNTWLRLHPSELCISPRGLFMKAPARGCNLSGPDPQAQPCPDLALTWHPQAGRQPAQCLPDGTPPPLQAPLAHNSHSAGYQPPSSRINYHTGPVS